MAAISDVQRYGLAINAGWTISEAVIATAISIAEDQPGDPAAQNPTSSALGLWQILPLWWGQFGGYAALVDPQGNAKAAHAIYKLQGWGAWAVYTGGQYLQFMARAQAAQASFLGDSSGASAAAVATSTPATVLTDGSKTAIQTAASAPPPKPNQQTPELDSLTYDLEILGQDGMLYHVPWGTLTWTEGQGSICATLSFTVPDMDIEPTAAAPNGWIGELLAEGSVVYLNAGPPGAMACQFQGRIYSHSRGLDTHSPSQATCHDQLFSLLQSKDDFVYPDSVTLRQVVTDMAQKWGLTLGEIDGSDKPIGPIVQRAAKLGDMLTKAMQLTQARGDLQWIVRANPNTNAIDVVRPGNTDMLALKAGSAVLGGQEQVSVESMVTRVRVYRSPAASTTTIDQNNHIVTGTGSGQQPAVLIDTRDGHTAFGILQETVYARRPTADKTQQTTDADALQAALDLLNGPRGQPVRQATLTAPLIGIHDSLGWHWPRRGQRVYVEAGSMKGFMVINSITVDVLVRQMQLQLNADYAAGWADGVEIDWTQPDSSTATVAGTNQPVTGATPAAGAASGGVDPSASTGAVSGFNPNTPTKLQTQSWTCSATSMAWMLESVGRPTSEALAVHDLGNDSTCSGRSGRIDPCNGLKDGSGAGMAATLREQGYGAQNSAVTYDDVLRMAGRVPLSMGSAKLYHWTAVRGSSGDTLQLANPAPNWQGIGQQMSRATFNAYAPWYAVWINLNQGSNSAPSPAAGGGPF